MDGLLYFLRKNKCKLGIFTMSNICELRACIMSSAIFVHLSPVYLRLSFLFLLQSAVTWYLPGLESDNSQLPQCLFILLCTSGKSFHMMATIKMPQQGRYCYCCNSQGVLIFCNFVIFFCKHSVCVGKWVSLVHHLLLMSIKQPLSLSHQQIVSCLCPSRHWEKIKLGVDLASGGFCHLL